MTLENRVCPESACRQAREVLWTRPKMLVNLHPGLHPGLHSETCTRDCKIEGEEKNCEVGLLSQSE